MGSRAVLGAVLPGALLTLIPRVRLVVCLKVFPPVPFFGGSTSHGRSSSQVLGSLPLNPGMVHGPFGRGPPPKHSQTPPTSRLGPTVSREPPPGAGTGYVRFDEGPLDPLLPLCLRNLLFRFSPLGPLPVVPPLSLLVVEFVADQLRALELLSSFMDLPEVEALRSRLVHPPVPVPSEPVLTSHRALAQELADKCERQEKLQTKLSEQRVKVAEEERLLERMQADLVGLVGEASDLDEEILELRRKVSVVPEPEDMDASVGQPPELLCVKGLKRELRRGTKSRS